MICTGLMLQVFDMTEGFDRNCCGRLFVLFWFDCVRGCSNLEYITSSASHHLSQLRADRNLSGCWVTGELQGVHQQVSRHQVHAQEAVRRQRPVCRHHSALRAGRGRHRLRVPLRDQGWRSPQGIYPRCHQGTFLHSPWSDTTRFDSHFSRYVAPAT